MMMKISRDNIFKGLLATLVVAPAMLLGAVHPSVLAFFILVSSCLLMVMALGNQHRFLRLDLPGVVILAMMGFTAFQLLPLPAGIVEFISPTAYEVRAAALVPLGGLVPGYMPLTLDTSMTTMELGKLFVYLAVYWGSLAWSRRCGSEYVLNLTVLVGAAGAAVFLLHRILMVDQVYGFYSPLHLHSAAGHISAPLINTNHMAALLGLCSAVAIGRALGAKERTSRTLLIFVAAIIGGTLLLTLSRGAIAAFIGGQLLFILLRVVHRITSDRKREKATSSLDTVGADQQNLAWLPIGLAVSLGLGMFVAQDAIIGEFVYGNAKKIELVTEGFPLFYKFPATGVGRGAFWVAFPLVSELAGSTVFTHAENVVVQMLVDWGVAGGLAILVMVLVVGRRLYDIPARVHHAAALAALVAFGMHNLLDFNIEIPGVAVVAVALMAVLQTGRKRTSKRLAPRALLIVVAVSAIFSSAVIGIRVHEQTVDFEQRSYAKAWKKKDLTLFSDQAITEALSRHPADWYIPFINGVRLYQDKTGNPIAWLRRSLDLNPSWAPSHYYVGLILLESGGFEQGLLEMRIATRLNPSMTRGVTDLLVKKYPSFDRLAKLAPPAMSNKEKTLLWGSLASSFAGRGLEDEALEADKAILAIDPSAPKSLAREIRRHKEKGQYKEAIEMARLLKDQKKYGAAGAVLEAEILEKEGKMKQATQVLQKQLTVAPHDAQLLRALAWNYQRSGRHKEAINTAVLLRTHSFGDKARARATVFEGDLELTEGRIHSALAKYRKAFEIDSKNPTPLRKIVRIADGPDTRLHQLNALKKLVNLDPQDDFAKQKLDELETKLKAINYSNH